MKKIEEKMLSFGWSLGTNLTEKVAQNADLNLAYKNVHQVCMNLLYFEAEKMIRIRVAHGQDVNWLQITEVGDNLDNILAKLTIVQDVFVMGGWFSFYLAFSGISKAAILAWEQYEPGYR